MEIMAVTFSLKTILAHAVQKVIQTVQPFFPKAVNCCKRACIAVTVI